MSVSVDVPLESDRFDWKSLDQLCNHGKFFNFPVPQFPHLPVGDYNSAWGESRADEMTLCFEKQLAWKCVVNPWKILVFVDTVIVKVPTFHLYLVLSYSLSSAWFPQLWSSLNQSISTLIQELEIWLYHTLSWNIQCFLQHNSSLSP